MGAYYGNAVSWAKQNGIVNGVTETEFAPNSNITREQIAAIMHRYAEYKGYDVSVADNVSKAETDIAEAEQDNVDMKVFLKTIRNCTELKELTPAIVNTLIKKSYVHNAEKIDERKK